MVFFVSILFVIVIIQQLEIVVLYKVFNRFFNNLIIKVSKQVIQEMKDDSEAE